MTIWLTADLHFIHFNIIRYCERPFEDLEEMHKHLIQKWNSVVEDDDTVYVLGDFGFVKKAPNEAAIISSKLKGKKHLIKGNHDKAKNSWYLEHGFESVTGDYIILKGVMLSHYPFEIDENDGKKIINRKRKHWEAYVNNKCTFHYYGHTHKSPIRGKDFCNIGVDLHEFTPVRFKHPPSQTR